MLFIHDAVASRDLSGDVATGPYQPEPTGRSETSRKQSLSSAEGQEATIGLIKSALDRGVNIKEVRRSEVTTTLGTGRG